MNRKWCYVPGFAEFAKSEESGFVHTEHGREWAFVRNGLLDATTNSITVTQHTELLRSFIQSLDASLQLRTSLETTVPFTPTIAWILPLSEDIITCTQQVASYFSLTRHPDFYPHVLCILH